MPRAKYQFEDFILAVTDEHKDFVRAVHGIMMQDGHKARVQDAKNGSLKLTYSKPKIKSTSGNIAIFLFEDDGRLAVRIYGKNHKSYPDALNGLPPHMEAQIDARPDCKKFVDPSKCWTGCRGYDFYIGEKLYQKCMTVCFQFVVDFESKEGLMSLVESESKMRGLEGCADAASGDI
ncbi:MAG: hypothetical protein FWC67_05095 [Defluviitaleaceae bacterium]|nr:hypothetical protein [Defluviitaleaceae bacterium]